MKTVIFLLPALVVSVPAYALSIVSLHGAPAMPILSSVDTTIVVVGVLALAAAIGFRVFRH